MVSLFVTAIISTTALAPVLTNFVFVAPGDLARPWTMVLYPLLGMPDALALLFDLGIIYLFCSSLERAWGTKSFSIFFVSISVISALALCLGAKVLGRPLPAENLLPVVGAAVVWGLVNAEERMSLFFIPMRGIHLAGIAVIYIMFNYARGAGWGAVPFALLGSVAAFGWLKYGITYRIQNWGDGLIPMSRPTPHSHSRTVARPKLKLVPDQNKPMDDRFTLRDLNPFEWLAKRKRRKKFEDLVGRDD